MRSAGSDSLEKKYRSSFSTADMGSSLAPLRSTPRLFSCILRLPSVAVCSGALGDLRHAPSSSTLMHSTSEISLGIAKLFCFRWLALSFFGMLIDVCSSIDSYLNIVYKRVVFSLPVRSYAKRGEFPKLNTPPQYRFSELNINLILISAKILQSCLRLARNSVRFP